MEDINKTSHKTMQDLFNSYDVNKISSHAGVRSDLFNRPLDRALITDFFGGVAQVEVTPPLSDSTSPPSPLFQGQDIPAPQQHVRQSRPIQLDDSPHAFTWFAASRELRAWSSAVAIGLLVGWVALRK